MISPFMLGPRMDMLDTIFDSGRATLTCIFNVAINSPLALRSVNKKIERYAEIYSIAKTDHGYYAELTFRGEERIVVLEVQEIRLSEDKEHIALYGLQSNTLWIHNLLKDHVEGREFALPENELLRKILGLL